MWLRSSVLALVGGGRNPFDSSNKVVIWNDAEQTAIAHMEFRLCNDFDIIMTHHCDPLCFARCH